MPEFTGLISRLCHSTRLLDGRVGGVAVTITGPLTEFTTEVMSSSRDYNHQTTSGLLAEFTNRLANWVQKKADKYRRFSTPSFIETQGRSDAGCSHLLKNGYKAGYFDYAAFRKYGPPPQKRRRKGKSPKSSPSAKADRAETSPPPETPPPEPPPPKPPERVARKAMKWLLNERGLPDEVGAAPLAAVALDRMKDGSADGAVIMALLLHELPGLDIDRMKPDEKKIRETIVCQKRQIYRLEADLRVLGRGKDKKKLIEDVQSDMDRLRSYVKLLENCLSILQSRDQNAGNDNFWSDNLCKRWKKSPNARYDLFEVVGEYRDLDEIEKLFHFPLLPQERSLLEMHIAVEELRDIYDSCALTTDQFTELVEALARGWPGVKDDSSSEDPELRANAAGCVRSLAQLANKGRLPRELLASFPEFDTINRALLIRAQKREMAGKFDELHAAERALRSLIQAGTGKEDPERLKLEACIEALRNDIRCAYRTPEAKELGADVMPDAGRKLGGLYADLMEAERNLQAVGVDVRTVRVDEHFIHGLDKTAPKLRKRIALMLARVALIEDEIAKLNWRYKRNIPTSDETGAVVRARIHDESPKWNEQLQLPATEFELASLIGRQSDILIEERVKQHPLLRIGLTRQDLLDMDIKSDRLAVIKKLGDLGFRNAKEVKLQNTMHRKIHDRIFDTNAGRAIARSAIGLTAAQLAGEYLDLVLRSVTGNHQKFDHKADDPEVCDAMQKRWGEIMRLTPEQEYRIAEADKVIKRTRNKVLKSLAKLGPGDSPSKEILKEHDYVDGWVKTLASRLTPRQRAFAAAMIRAAILAARPRDIVGDNARFEYIDAYDASRYRPQIFAILKSWGMDVELFEVLIDSFVFSRAENSALAPGTVTAQKLARWKKAFRPEEIFNDTAEVYPNQARQPKSWKKRAKALARDGLVFAASHFSGKAFRKIDTDFVNQFVVDVVNLGDHEKIALRTHTQGQGSFKYSQGVKVPVSLGGGDQTGIIIKRTGKHIHIRLLSGAVGSGLLGAGGEIAFGVGAVGFTAAGSHSRWSTKGVALKFTVVDENGRENFERVESYLRSLLTGKLATTEDWVNAASESYAIKKWGHWTKHIEGIDAVLGPSVDVPALGSVSAGVGASLAREGRLRTRDGEYSNAFGTESYTKETDTTTGSVAVNAGMSVGFENVGEMAAAVKSKTLLGVAAGPFGLNYNNISYYYDDRNPDKVNWDICLDAVGSAEEVLAQCGPDIAAHLMPLLDETTTLENGEEMNFRTALDRMLKLERYNDGFLMQFELHPAVKREVARCMRRKTQIKGQMLPGMKSGAEKEELLVELARIEDHIAQATDRNNVKNFVLTGAWVVPMLFQQNDMTVFNGLGMARVTHTGVRLQDVNAFGVRAPRPKTDREVAEELLGVAGS